MYLDIYIHIHDVAFFDLPMAKFGPSHYGPATMYSTRPVSAVGEIQPNESASASKHGDMDFEMFEMSD